jgi:hypothetical protein
MSLNVCAHGTYGRTISWDVPLSHAHSCEVHMGCPTGSNMSHGVRGPVCSKYLLGCTLLPYCPTTLLPYRPTALLPYCPTALLPYCPTALPPYCPTNLLSYCPTALLPYHSTGTLQKDKTSDAFK